MEPSPPSSGPRPVTTRGMAEKGRGESVRTVLGIGLGGMWRLFPSSHLLGGSTYLCGLLPLRASAQVDPSRGCARALCHATYSQVLSTP